MKESPDGSTESLFASITPFPLGALIPWSATESIEFRFSEEDAATMDFAHTSQHQAIGMALASEDDVI